jgi:hypothetical protein
LTRSGRYDERNFAGTGRGTGLIGPNKEQDQGKGRRRQGRSITGRFCTSGEAERKRLGEGEPLADFTASFQRYGLFQLIFSSGSGATALATCGMLSPWGETKRGFFFALPFVAFPSLKINGL